MMTKCHVGSSMGSWQRKKTLGENEGYLHKVWTLVDNNT